MGQIRLTRASSTSHLDPYSPADLIFDIAPFILVATLKRFECCKGSVQSML